MKKESSLHLPVSNADEVERFKQLYLKTYRVELSDAEALEGCLTLVKYIYVQHYALPNLLKRAGEPPFTRDQE
jgi:hypothetical protein